MEPSFGARLKAWLAYRDLTQTAFGEKLELSRTTVWEWLNDTAAPPMRRLPDVMAALGTTQAEFFGSLPGAAEKSAPDGQVV